MFASYSNMNWLVKANVAVCLVAFLFIVEWAWADDELVVYDYFRRGMYGSTCYGGDKNPRRLEEFAIKGEERAWAAELYGGYNQVTLHWLSVPAITGDSLQSLVKEYAIDAVEPMLHRITEDQDEFLITGTNA